MKRNHFFLLATVLTLSCNESVKTKPKEATTVDSNLLISNNLLNNLKKDSNNIVLQQATANSLDSAGNYKEAIKLYDKLIAKDNANQDYWIEKARLHSKNLDTANAIRSFVMATKIYPKPIAMLELANLFAETKNINTIKVCEDLMKLNPEGNYNAKANYFIARYYTNINNSEKSLQYLEKCLTDDFHFTEAYIEKGYILFNRKNYQAALKNFQLMNTFNQKCAEGYYWQGKCFEALNNNEAAVENYKKALKLDTSIEEAVHGLKRLKAS